MGVIPVILNLPIFIYPVTSTPHLMPLSCSGRIYTFNIGSKRHPLKSQENLHSQDPLAVLPSHFPSGLSVMRIISICSPCLKLSSFFPPLTSQQAFA